MVITAGNDRLFQAFCRLLGREELASDPRFATNPQRVRNRAELLPILQELLLQRDTASWLEAMRAAGVPCGAINEVSQVFNDPQIVARDFVWECEHPKAGPIRLVGSPMNLSETPTRLYKAPPMLGEDNEKV